MNVRSERRAALLDRNRGEMYRPLAATLLGINPSRPTYAAIEHLFPVLDNAWVLSGTLMCFHANSKGRILAAPTSCGTATGRVPAVL